MDEQIELVLEEKFQRRLLIHELTDRYLKSFQQLIFLAF